MRNVIKSISDAVDRLFHDRRIVILSEHRTMHLKFSKNFQMAAVIILLLGLSWIPFSAGRVVASNELISSTRYSKHDYSTTERRVESVENDILMLEEYIKALHKFDNFVIYPDLETASGSKAEKKSGDTVSGLEEQRDNLLKELQKTSVNRIAAIESFLNSTGVDYKAITGKEIPGNRENMGGPYIPANLHDIASDSNENLMITSEFINELNYLFELQKMVSYLPYSVPISFNKVSSYYGIRRDPFGRGWAMHSGIDLAASKNSYVMATGPGKVVRAGRERGYGIMVEVAHGYGFATRYGHMSGLAVKKGDMVERGQIIGMQGCTGRCTGDHLHYEVRYNQKPINPLKFLSKSGNIQYYYAKVIR